MTVNGQFAASTWMGSCARPSTSHVGLLYSMNPQNHKVVGNIATDVPTDRRWLDWSVVALILAIKALVLILGSVAYTVWQNKPPAGLHGWMEIWSRWDGTHYLDIARDGYVTQGDERNWIVFYPL